MAEESNPLRFFISYSTEDGEGYARKLKSVLSNAGHSVWAWAADSTLGAYTWEEIARETEACDVFVCILTPSSANSKPQRSEVNLAMSLGKPVWALVRSDVSDATVWTELKAANYWHFSDADFDDRCARLIEQVGPLPGAVVQMSAPEIKRWRSLIHQLRQRTSSLNQNRLAEVLKEARQSYLASTIPRKVLRFTEERKPDTSYQIISVRETRSLATFNDPSYSWGHYFSDMGRIIAGAERRYLVESLLAADSEPPVEMDLSNPDLALIDGMANDLARAGFPAGAMFVPTSLPPEFYDLYYDRIEWEGHPRLQTPFGQMNIYWESELEHFILISHQAGVWQVVPDADTGEALTVAVGAERLYPDLIRIVGGTVAQFDVLEPRAFRTIRAVKGLKHLSSLTDRGVSARLA